MITAALGWFVAGVFFVALLIFWFSVSYHELAQKHRTLEVICEQVAMHRALAMQERGGANDGAAQNILAAKLIAYDQVTKEYNALLKKPMYQIPGYLLGFRPEGKGQKQDGLG